MGGVLAQARVSLWFTASAVPGKEVVRCGNTHNSMSTERGLAGKWLGEGETVDKNREKRLLKTGPVSRKLRASRIGDGLHSI